MEVGFWQFLCKEGPDGLPLKQRIPEVAYFTGSELKDCYFSTQRGLLQKRTGHEATREALLGRLHSLTRKRFNREVSLDTPAAILRRSSSAAPGAPPVASVLTVGEVTEVLHGSPSTQNVPGESQEQWSLQSIVRPVEDLRIVAVYSRDGLGQERVDVVGRSYRAMYKNADGQGLPEAGASRAAIAVVPRVSATAAEAKAMAMVQYVKRFFGRSVESLIAEFLVDEAGRIILHGFWKTAFCHASATLLPDRMQADDTCNAVAGTSATHDCSISSTACTSGPDGLTASASSDNYASMSRPTSATLSRPTSASRIGSRPNSARATAREASAGEERSAGSLMGLASLDAGDLQIPDDDGGGDDIDETIERLQAARRPQVQHRRRPGNAGRSSNKNIRAARREEAVRILLELWEFDNFLGEIVLSQSGCPSESASVEEDQLAPTLLSLTPHAGIRNDMKKQNARPVSSVVKLYTAWELDQRGAGTLRLKLLCAQLPAAETHAIFRRQVRAHIWACATQEHGFGYECRPLWSSGAACKADSQDGQPAEMSVFEWASEETVLGVPLPAALRCENKRPCSARAQSGPNDNTSVSTTARPASARSTRQQIGSTRGVSAERGGSMQRSCSPSAFKKAKPPRPSSARPQTRSRPCSARKGQRPSSARRQANSGSERGSVNVLNRSVDAADATYRPRSTSPANVHSNQLLSRFQAKRDLRTRLISTLARQAERNRDMLPIWDAQRSVARAAVERAEHELFKRSADIEELAAEREHIEKLYAQKYDALVRCLSLEQERSATSAQAKRQELHRSIDKEKETCSELSVEETKNEQLRTALDRSMTRLHAAQVEYRQAHSRSANAEQNRLQVLPQWQPATNERFPKVLAKSMTRLDAAQGDARQADIGEANAENNRIRASPEWQPTKSRVELLESERDQTLAETQATEAVIAEAEAELQRQRVHIARMEAFARKVATSVPGSAYSVDPWSKREAQTMLAAAASQPP